MSEAKRDADVIVLGAGAAGLMCAAVAAARGRDVLVLERNEAPGRKVLISGGGRCNFTNLRTTPDNFLSANPHFAKSALARFTPRDILDMVEAHGVSWHEKHLGQLFCDNSSKAVLGMLLEQCRLTGAPIRTGIDVRHARPSAGGFTVATGDGDLRCESLVVATGGCSWTQLGATDLGYRLARSFGLPITDLRPGLVPLILDGLDLAICVELSGVSFPARVSCGAASFDDDVLLTHHGLSGPAILQASSYWTPGAVIVVDLLPGVDLVEMFEIAAAKNVISVLARRLPKRLAHGWCARHGFDGRWADMTQREQDRLLATLCGWTLHPVGTAGYDKAEVTVGGVATDALSSKTLESRSVPGLYFIGEVVDVTGWLGGYNFQWAWASGRAAGEVV